MRDVHVIEQPAAAAAALDPIRGRLLAELTEAVTALAARYHDESAPGGRSHRLLALAHPMPYAAQPEGNEEPS